MTENQQNRCVRFNSAEFSGWVNGDAQNMPESFCGVTQDTRKLRPGMLYVALNGENFDGHNFVGAAFDAGAAGALVDDSWRVPEELTASALIRVADTRSALLAAAHAWRDISSAKIIGVTGSSGKTTTKEIAAAIFAAGGEVCSTEGNLNNDIGLPLSVLGMSAECDFGIFELGTNHPGEIALLANVLHPNIGVITSVGSAHIENFGSVEAIAREKGALLAAIAPGGCAILSQESQEYSLLKRFATVPVVTVSIKNSSVDYYGELIDVLHGRVMVTDVGNGKKTELESGLPGDHNASNLMLAFAAARVAGIEANAAAGALNNLVVPGMRWQTTERGDGITVINDAYNANPESVKAVLSVFSDMICSGRKIVVLGDMLELGDFAEVLHRDTGAAAADISPDMLLLVGPLSSCYTLGGAVCKGLSLTKIFCFDDADSAGSALKDKVCPGDTVLLKGSRGMHLEEMLDLL